MVWCGAVLNFLVWFGFIFLLMLRSTVQNYQTVLASTGSGALIFLPVCPDTRSNRKPKGGAQSCAEFFF